MKIKATPYQCAALFNPYDHFAMICGIASGKTYTGAHYSIMCMHKWPHLTGFIGANNYDQLSTATLKELFYWLTEYQIPFVCDKRPPATWKPKMILKDYNNVLTIFVKDQCVTVFLRTLSDGDAFRGIEFSWYWIDESRDTPQNSHDIILSRLREDAVIVKGLITTTSNGEDWVFKRCCKGNKGDRTYGSMHVPTIEAVKYGIISQNFYNTLRSSYSLLMAQQELDAIHVNVRGGRAYHSQSSANRLVMAPWGDREPNPMRPLIVSCDFNYHPAPCVWSVGQVGPSIIDPKTGMYFHDFVHWFGQISDTQISTPAMVDKLVAAFPGFYLYQFYGDSSGTRGTTSNAGETDFIQIGTQMTVYSLPYSIDVDNANPRIRDRVESVNAMLCAANGIRRMTYNPYRCPLLDEDFKNVGWRKTGAYFGKDQLDDGGDKTRTHASDNVGYFVIKRFPLGRPPATISTLPSMIRGETVGLF